MHKSDQLAQSPRQRNVWIIAAVVMGIWIPLRFTILRQNIFIEAAVDLACIVLFIKPLHKKFLKIGLDGSKKDFFLKSVIPIFFDLGAAIPFATLSNLASESDTKYSLLLKLLILSNISKIRHLIDSIDGLHPVVTRLVPLAFIVPLIMHFFACGWIALGNGSDGAIADKHYEYVRALYWAVTTLATVGYGDISAKTIPQMFYAGFTMIIGVGFFGYVLSNVSSLLARLDAAREQHLNSLDNIESFMQYNQIPVRTRLKIRAYFKYLWESRRGLNSVEVTRGLPQNLRAEIAMHLNAGVIQKVPLFKDADLDFLQDILLKLEPKVCVPEEKIFHVGEIGDAMYFIHHGTVDIVNKNKNVLATLTDGAFFGEMALILNNPRSATALSKSYCDVYMLSKESFTTVLDRYPKFAAKLQQHVEVILSKS